MAKALVAGSSAAVLMLEILAGRLLAPYVGVSLETFTGIIGVVLAGIAIGAWAGGALSDSRDPASMIGPCLLLGGALSWLSLPLISALGPQFDDGAVAITMLSLIALFPPAAVLSAISPMVAKLVLRDLSDTGTVVGGLSAFGTLGALVGTFVTGFVLVSALPTRLTVIAIGAALVIWGILTHWHLTRSLPTMTAAGLLVLSGIVGVAAGQPCDHVTTYFCANVIVDDEVASGRSLWLDGIRHAYVDLDDPTNLDIRYIRLFASVADAQPDGPIDSLHIGGGGFSFPRYLEEVRPGSTAVVLEIDGALVDLVEDELGLAPSDSLQTQVGDARLALADMSAASFDLAIGDAFASRSVPWHLTTREFLGEVDRVLRDDGVYVMNVIDGGGYDFARAELATLAEIFEHVRAIVPTNGLDAFKTANVVLIAAHSPIDTSDAIALDEADGVLWTEAETRAWMSDAEPLRDDFAPVDQLQQ